MAIWRWAAAALAAAALVGCGGSGGAGTTSPSGFARAPVDRAEVRGPADAYVTVVEFGDFECPFCRSAESVVREVLAAYPDDVRLAWRQFPLASIHPSARPAAVASECARAQGRFWEMHDLLVTGALGEVGLEAAAQASGLDAGAWQVCRGDPTTAGKVDADLALGRASGVAGTPAFAVNGDVYLGAPDLATFRGWVDAALARARASGIPAAEYYDRAVLGR